MPFRAYSEQYKVMSSNAQANCLMYQLSEARQSPATQVMTRMHAST